MLEHAIPIQGIKPEGETPPHGEEVPLLRYPPVVDYERIRNAVEAQSGPLEFEKLFHTGRITQKVVIRPKEVEVEFQTMNGAENLYAKARAFKDAADSSIEHHRNYEALCVLTLSLRSVFGKELKDHLVGGKVDDAIFTEKFQHVTLSYPGELLGLLDLNRVWFSERVQARIAPELKNG